MEQLIKIVRLLGVRGPFEPTHRVWSRGLALMCEHNGGKQFVRQQRGGRALLPFSPGAYDNVREGDLVWVRATALPQFVREVLPYIRAHFALVTGDEDWSMPSDFPLAHDIIANEYVICWFTQNFDGNDTSGKILPLPIGMDFHTISNRRKWGHPMATPREQERELEVLRRAMRPNSGRLCRVHADFHFNQHDRAIGGETRIAIEAALRKNPCIEFQRDKVPRLDLWREKTRYAFVVSPHGNGLDCHRTWESLALDNIVIVKRSPLDPLYEGLPVVIIDTWDEINAANLQRWHAQLGDSFDNPEVQTRLTNGYWIERVRKVLAQRLAERQSRLQGCNAAASFVSG